MINSGKANCPILQSCLRELAFLSAIYECEVRSVYLDTESNRLADHLSSGIQINVMNSSFIL